MKCKDVIYMALEIRTTSALIGIDRAPSRLEIKTEKARLDLHQKHAKINIRTELPRVEIDQYECFASAGLKGNRDLVADAAQRGYQQFIEFVGKKAGDGDILAAVHNRGNPIADIAQRNSRTIHEFGLDFIPKARPKIEVRGDVELDPERNSEGTNNGVEGQYTPGSIDIGYTPANVSVYLRQYASISINYQGNNVDYSV